MSIPQRRFRVANLKLREISTVDRPAQAGALAVLIKSAGATDMTDIEIRKNAAAVVRGEPATFSRDQYEGALLKPSKSSLVQYTKAADGQVCELIAGKGKNGLEYLGFRFDGRDVFLRDATMSNLYRKVASVARNQAEATVKRYPGKTYDELCEAFNFEQFSKRFGRVEGFEPTSSNKKWTFWTYVVRAAEEFGPAGRKIMGQVRRLKRRSRARVGNELERALQRKMKRDVGAIELS